MTATSRRRPRPPTAPLAIDTPDGRAWYVAGSLPAPRYLLAGREYRLLPSGRLELIGAPA